MCFIEEVDCCSFWVCNNMVVETEGGIYRSAVGSKGK